MKKARIILLMLIFILASVSSACTTTASIETVTQSTVREKLSTNEIISRISPAVAHILGDYGAGTGIVIDNRGYILTNNHVVEGEDYLIVRLPNRAEVIGTIQYQDSNLDIAIIKCPGANYTSISLGDMVDLGVGDDVVLIGYPLGSLVGSDPSTSRGIISAFRHIEGLSYIQTDAPMNPGNSGGPLINQYGDVIGLATWGLADTQGMNFAINLNNIKTHIKDILEQLTKAGIPAKPITNTITVTAPGKTITKTVIIAVNKFVCPACGKEFDNLNGLQSHYQAEHQADVSTTKTVTQTQTITVTQQPPPTTTSPPSTSTTPTQNVVFTFTGIGERNTPPFSINSSPWILRYSTSFDGSFFVDLVGEKSVDLLRISVTAGEVYETYIYDKTGEYLYFNIRHAPHDGEWTLTVIELS